MSLFLFRQINQLAGKSLWLDTLGILFAQYFGYILLFCLFLFLLVNLRKYWKMVTAALVSGLFARLVLVNLIRWILPKARPFVENQVNLLITHPPTSAFPSGHASFYFAIVAVVFLYFKKMKKPPKFWWLISLLFFLISLAIGIARVFCGIHWPSDILAGVIVGIFSGWLVYRILIGIKK